LRSSAINIFVCFENETRTRPPEVANDVRIKFKYVENYNECEGQLSQKISLENNIFKIVFKSLYNYSNTPIQISESIGKIYANTFNFKINKESVPKIKVHLT